MRILIPAGTLVTAVTASLLLAPSAYATPKGDNGTVKIHDATTGAELRRNEPKVCSFYLDSFGFDSAQKVAWHIEAWANNDLDKGETVKSGSLVLDAEGHGRTADMTLPDGQYKLFWNFEGENGRAKHKVFKTDCGDEAKPGKPGEEPGKPGEEPGEKPEEKPVEKPSVAPSAPSDEKPADNASAPAAAPSEQGGTGEGDLAETGSSAPVGAMAAVAVALAAAGGFLVMRRRKAQQH